MEDGRTEKKQGAGEGVGAEIINETDGYIAHGDVQHQVGDAEIGVVVTKPGNPAGKRFQGQTLLQ